MELASPPSRAIKRAESRNEEQSHAKGLFLITFPPPSGCFDGSKYPMPPVWVMANRPIISIISRSHHPRSPEMSCHSGGNCTSQRERRRAARVPSGRRRGHDDPGADRRKASGIRQGEDLRSDRHAGPRHHVPRALGGRQGRSADQPRIPSPIQQRHRPVQGRAAPPPVGQPGDHQVPRLRADLQELADHAAHGRRQGRIGLRSEGEIR